ncbi:UNVERIFIED_CONTAM: putative late blight resistance proteinR1A-10 [Sesamum angustifolium]|uniref:Late blight resistance proteinR1A-10 n=1 Tax=Sesamum angustifolium TaxID=2727405 RepID=A0AAW2RIM0_9LAMI
MAYAAVVSLAQTLQHINHHHQYCSIPLICEEQLFESLQEKLTFLQVFLEIDGETVEGLEGRIRDLAYRAEDIIESHVSDQISSEHERYMDRELQNSEKKEADLRVVMEAIDSIVERVMNIQNSCAVEDVQCSYTSAVPSSGGAPNDGNKMVGFNEDLLELKARLCGKSSKLQIISIVGMGGIGKTTLATNIFNDSLVAYHFHVRVWTTVSQDYHLRQVLRDLVASLTDQKTTDLSDMKDEELVSNGSRVLMTTRLSDVAVYASSSPLHQMRFLDEEWSWNLLRDKVFEQQSCLPELERIGRTIAQSCGGLPLAIAVVAGILAKVDRTQYHWEKIVENIREAVATNDERLLEDIDFEL